MNKSNHVSRAIIVLLIVYVTVFSVFFTSNVHAQLRLNAAASTNSVPQQMAVNYTEIAAQAYIFGYPLMTFYITKGVLTNVPAPIYTLAKGLAVAPVNQFANVLNVPNSNFTAVVAPNADTLYSVAYVDLAKEPMVLSVPDTRGRYYLMPMLDAWTDVFASPGTRTTGDRAGNFLIESPTWKGTVPAGMTELKSPTSLIWIIGRTEVNRTSPADVAAVNAIQKQYKLTPLSAWGASYTPPSNVPVDPTVNMTTPPLYQVNNMANDPAKYFNLMAQLMADNPPYAADAPMMVQLAQIGIAPGKPFDWNGLTPQVRSQILAGTKSALAQLQNLINWGGVTFGRDKIANGWLIMYGLGNYTNVPTMKPNTFDAYLLRAYVAAVGYGANLPQDSIYPQSRVDANGQPYSGRKQYVLHFNSGQTPPYNGFWSLTMYDNDGFFIANPINRYAIGNRNPLKFNPDRSLDIYIQNADPGPDERSNWLPAPTGVFYVVLRVYWPQQTMLDGQWVPPGITQVTQIISTSEMMTTTAAARKDTTTYTGVVILATILVAIALAAGVYMLRRKRTLTTC
jgi:hypothetical protein